MEDAVANILGVLIIGFVFWVIYRLIRGQDLTITIGKGSRYEKVNITFEKNGFSIDDSWMSDTYENRKFLMKEYDIADYEIEDKRSGSYRIIDN